MAGTRAGALRHVPRPSGDSEHRRADRSRRRPARGGGAARRAGAAAACVRRDAGGAGARAAHPRRGGRRPVAAPRATRGRRAGERGEMKPAAPRWRPLVAFAVVLAAGLSAHSAGLTQKADQALRSMFRTGLIDVLPAWAAFATVLLALCGWFGRTSWRKAAVVAGCGVAVLGLALLLARRGDYLPVGAIILALAFSGLARLAYDLLYDAWRTEATRAGARGRLCVMVFDLQGFVARADKLPAEQAIALLNECFTAVMAGADKRGGSATRLLGAGAIALFGATQALDCPEKNALEAAQDILEALSGISARLEAAQGAGPLEPAIGLHAGDVAFGQVGGRRRQDYTALGPVVTLAAELQRLASGAIADPVVCSAQVADAVGRAGGLRELGQRTVAGEVLTLFAWTPPVLAPEAEAKTA